MKKAKKKFKTFLIIPSQNTFNYPHYLKNNFLNISKKETITNLNKNNIMFHIKIFNFNFRISQNVLIIPSQNPSITLISFKIISLKSLKIPKKKPSPTITNLNKDNIMVHIKIWKRKARRRKVLCPIECFWFGFNPIHWNKPKREKLPPKQKAFSEKSHNLINVLLGCFSPIPGCCPLRQVMVPYSRRV